jgi:MFS family permease
MDNLTAWISTSYLITATAFQPLYGRFSDVLGRRTCFLAATVIFWIGSLLCGVAPSMLMLNLARALTGIGKDPKLSNQER